MSKNPCPVSRTEYRANAPRTITITVSVPGQPDQVFEADIKAYDTGSEGYNLNAKPVVMVGGVKVPHQLGVNCTAIGSKELPRIATGTSQVA